MVKSCIVHEINIKYMCEGRDRKKGRNRERRRKQRKKERKRERNKREKVISLFPFCF